MTQKGVVTDGWLFPSASTLSTDRRVATQRTRPSLAVCREVRKEGWTGGERQVVSSKKKSPETLGTLRREGGSPWLCSPVAGLWSFLRTYRHSPGLGFPPPAPTATLISGPIIAESADPPCYPRPAEGRSVLTNLALALGLHLTALLDVFHMHMAATFLPDFPTPLPPLTADAPAPTQGL